MQKDTALEGVRSVKSAARILDLLELIGSVPDGLPFTRLSKESGIPKSSLHALLEVLKSRDYIELDPETRRYTLGIRVWETGYAYQRRLDGLHRAQHVLENIVARVNETAQFTKLVGSENVYLAKVDSTHALRLQSEVGMRLPAHATGVGKALLACLDDDEVRARLPDENLPVFTVNTISTVTELLRELSAIRKRGFAIDKEEYTAGVFCVAVPIFDSDPPVTGLSVSVPTTRISRGRIGQALSVLAESSLQVSAGRDGGELRTKALAELTDPQRAAAAIDRLAKSGRYALQFAGPEPIAV